LFADLPDDSEVVLAAIRHVGRWRIGNPIQQVLPSAFQIGEERLGLLEPLFPRCAVAQFVGRRLARSLLLRAKRFRSCGLAAPCRVDFE
jgi:hypothetical protein